MPLADQQMESGTGSTIYTWKLENIWKRELNSRVSD